MMIGQALRKYDIPRRKVVLMTKVGRVMADDGEHEGIPFMSREAAQSKDHVNQFGKANQVENADKMNQSLLTSRIRSLTQINFRSS